MFGPAQLPYVLAGVVLMTLQPILVTLSQTEDGRIEYSPVSSTLLSETCKIGISFVLHATSADRSRARLLPREVIEFSVPAFIYFVNNNLVFFILLHVDATTFQLLSQLKTLFTGLLFRLFLKRELTAHQYLAIWMLSCGTAVSQLPSCSGAPDVGGSGLQPRSSVLGLLGSVVSCFLSALGGVYNEKLMKGKPKESIHLQNIQLYSWGVAFNLLGVLLNKSPEALSHSGIFSGYNFWAVAVVANNALNGLAISAILKHADNIARVFAHAIAMLLTMVISVFCFRLQPSPQLIIAIAIVSASAVQYNLKPASVHAAPGGLALSAAREQGCCSPEQEMSSEAALLRSMPTSAPRISEGSFLEAEQLGRSLGRPKVSDLTAEP